MTSPATDRAAEAAYDPIARGMHWLNAILAVVAVALAWGISGAPRHGDARHWLLVLHGSFGVAILGLMAFWAQWRLRHSPAPLPPAMRGAERLLARATHAALFLLFAGMPLSGYVGLAAAGQAVSLFGIVAIPPLVPESGRLSQAAIALHLTGQFLLYGLVGLHVAAALMHGLVRRDGVLERMLPRRV